MFAHDTVPLAFLDEHPGVVAHTSLHDHRLHAVGQTDRQGEGSQRVGIHLRQALLIIERLKRGDITVGGVDIRDERLVIVGKTELHLLMMELIHISVDDETVGGPLVVSAEHHLVAVLAIECQLVTTVFHLCLLIHRRGECLVDPPRRGFPHLDVLSQDGRTQIHRHYRWHQDRLPLIRHLPGKLLVRAHRYRQLSVRRLHTIVLCKHAHSDDEHEAYG